MDYSQRYQSAQDAVQQSFDKNEDEVLKIPNFSLMERLLVVGRKDPWLYLTGFIEQSSIAALYNFLNQRKNYLWLQKTDI